ncbi:unnamed protein product [Heterobilharzia americana]|nr:unnamed protein product [Heterobilharzia americana]
MTSVRAEQLYNLMKRLYDLALTAENRSSIIASPEELERIFQLDGDTRKLSENLERAIALQKQLSSYQNFPSCESNSSSHEEVILQPGEIINVKANDHKDNGSNKLSSSFTRRGGLQTNKKNSIHSQLFTSQDSSSNQDSGLSTPPESSDGTKQEHDESNHQNNLHLSSHHHRHRLLPPQKTSSNVSNNNNNNNNNNKNSQTENSFGAQKHSHSDSGFDVCSQTVQLQKQSVYGEHKKSSINICPVEIKHEDKKDISKRSPNCYSPTHSYSPSTKQRIDALEDGVRLLKENLENFCLKTGNSPPITELENLKSVCQQNIHQFASSSSNSHNSLPFSGVNRSDVIAFPYFSASSPFMNSNNGSGNHPFLPAGQPNFTYPYNDTVDIPMSKTEVSNESKYNPRSRQEICEDVVQHNSDFKNTAPRPCRTYHRTLDRRLIYTQQNDSSYSSSSPKTQNVGKQCMKSKQNRYVARDLSNTTRKISHNSGNIRDFSCSREANRHSQPNKSETHYSSNSMRGRSAKYYSTYQLNKQRDSSTSSISSECSTEDSPTLGSHTSSSENSSFIDDYSKLPHSSRCKLKGGSSIPKSRLHVDHLRNPVTKSILRDDKLKSHEKTHRSSSLCKPESYRAPLRSVTNTHCNYGSLNHLNCLPLNKTGISGDTPYLKPVHKLMNSFGGSVPVVADPEASFESVYLHQPVQQQSSRVYTAFENIQRKPQVSLKPSVYFYPSTERILYSQPIQTSSEQYAYHNHDGVLFSARIPNNVNNTTTVCPKTMTCGACGGSGQVLESCNIGNFVNTRFIEPPLIRPTIGLNPLYRKTLSSARTKESRARPLRATHPCDISFVQCPSNLFENENIGRNFTPNFSVNPSTHYHPSSDRTEHPNRFGSLSRVNKRCQLKHLNSSNHAYIPSVHSSKRSQHLTDNINYNSKNNVHHIANTYSSEDSGSGTTSDEKLRSRKQMIRTNEHHHHHHHHPNSEENSSWQSTPASNPHLSSLSALQEILKTASSTSRLAQKLRCSLEDLCKPN